MAADRNLLFGLLALQNGLIDQDQLVAAFRAWTRDKARTLASHLAARGDLDGDQRAAIEALVGLHVKKHGDVERSLAALPVGGSTRVILAGVGDPEVEASLALVRPGSTEPDDSRSGATMTMSVGTSTSDGQRFRVLRPHARGGLGAVFVALDAELNREVALKEILDHHADDPASRQRFLLEAEITGGLEHPGIVPVYGLGSYGDGRPYYAMRFVKGDSLKEAVEHFHADETLRRDPGRRSLALRKLLRRFTDVCNAIDYAHSRGVLHRDIKPGNIIVGRHGETLVVDWGLAKPLGRVEPGSGAGERTLVPSSASGSAETLPGSAVGTPAYMSPEQARGDLDALGPRSDVYSLGATLYTLLTGARPFDGDDVGAVLRRVQAGDFPPPRALDPTIDRALEAVCLKAMALKPGDRYPTPRALAEDVERWAADEPVSAWREPFSRRARRWARRHRPAVTGAAVAVLAGLAGLAAVAAVQTRANAKLRDANFETTEALAGTRKAKAATEAALGQSEESRRQAEAVSAFLVDAFRSPDPTKKGRDVRVADVLDRATDRLGKTFSGTAATRGALLHALGETYYALGLYDRAGAVWADAHAAREVALGPDHPDTLKSLDSRAAADRAAGRLPEAIANHERALRARERTLGPGHADALESRNNLAIAYLNAGRTADAAAMLEGAVKAYESKYGPDHPDTLVSRNNLATIYRAAGRTAEAVALHEGTLRMREAKLGPDHPDTLTSRSNLAMAYLNAGRTADAIALGEGILRARESALGPRHPDMLTTRNNLALAYRAAGRLAEAVPMFEGTIKVYDSVLGPSHPRALTIRSNLAAAYESLDRWADAERLRRDVAAGHRKTGGPLLAEELSDLGRNLLRRSKWPEAEPVLREALAIQEKAARNTWSRYDTMSLLGGSLLGQGRYAEAEPLVVAGYEGLKAREGVIAAPKSRLLPDAAVRVVRLYEAWDKQDKADAWKGQLGLVDLPADVFARP